MKNRPIHYLVFALILMLVLSNSYHFNEARKSQSQLRFSQSRIYKLESKIADLENAVTNAKRNDSVISQFFNEHLKLFHSQFNYRLKELKRSEYSGLVELKYPNGKIYKRGYLLKGNEINRWQVFNPFGELLKEYLYVKYRVGADCCDGTISRATGQGACSWHGGVCAWRYEYRLE